MRLIVRGPGDYDDFDLVRAELDRLTAKYDRIVLVSDVRPDVWSSRPSCSNFPLAEKWMQARWKKMASFGQDPTRFAEVVYHYQKWLDDKRWSAAVKQRRLDMITDADMLIAFHDVGGDDYETEEMIRLSKLYDLKLRKVLI